MAPLGRYDKSTARFTPYRGHRERRLQSASGAAISAAVSGVRPQLRWPLGRPRPRPATLPAGVSRRGSSATGLQLARRAESFGPSRDRCRCFISCGCPRTYRASRMSVVDGRVGSVGQAVRRGGDLTPLPRLAVAHSSVPPAGRTPGSHRAPPRWARAWWGRWAAVRDWPRAVLTVGLRNVFLLADAQGLRRLLDTFASGHYGWHRR